MNEVSTLLTLALVHTVALISPGPDFALVVQNASRHGRAIGLAIALGISLAILLHSLFALTGMSLLIQQHPVLPAVLRVLGGSYLLWLGWGALKAARASLRQGTTDAPMAAVPALADVKGALLKGFTTNLLNPKALVFFLSLLSSLVPASMSLTGKSIAVLLLWGLSFAWFALLTYLLTGQRMQRALASWTPYIDGTCGVLFLVVGGSILAVTLFGA